MTLDLYSHVLPGMQAEAVSRVDAALEDALNRRGKTELVAKPVATVVASGEKSV